MMLHERFGLNRFPLTDLDKYENQCLGPCKQDVGVLLLKNNRLESILSERERIHQSQVKKLKRRNKEVQAQLCDLEVINKHSAATIKALEKELLEKNKKILNLVSDRTIIINTDDNEELVPTELPEFEVTKDLGENQEKIKDVLWESKAQANDLKVVNMIEVMEKRSAELLEELEDFQNDNQHQSELIMALKCQMALKDKEIELLHHALEGGRCASGSSHNTCTHCKQKDCRIKSLEEQLEAAVAKQHEAMSRALQLAGKNQLLERELKDIDNVALAVEEECQNKVKRSLKDVEVLQEKLKGKLDEIKALKDTVAHMGIEIEQNREELENLRTGKKVLEKHLNAAAAEKKNLNDKINHFVLIEKNLKIEVTKLQEINKSLLRQIREMEERVMDVLGSAEGKPAGKQMKKGRSQWFSSSNDSARSSNLKSFSFSNELPKCFGGRHECPTSSDLLEKLYREKEFYHNECCRLKELLGSLHGSSDNDPELLIELKNKEREIRDLKQEVVTLRRDSCALFKKCGCGDHLSSSSGDSMKIILDRLERERDKAFSDILRLQGERDAMKEKMKLATESQTAERLRLEKIIIESEERIRRLESERRELMSSHASQRVALAGLEEKCDEFKEQTRSAQIELTQMATNYGQLKTLQEQTDRSLSDVQGRLSEVSMELKFAANRIKELEKEKADSENDLCVLKKEKSALKSNLAFTEKEKDGLLIILDEKTEKVAKLENEIAKQESYVSELTEKISHLEKKFELALSEKSNREHGLRSLERAVEHLKEELQQSERQKEAFVRENRRLQDDLASAAKDCLAARRELDGEKEEVENLKRQLQQYVGEVKRAEELLSKKETERNQMLDHFRSLSLEATALESNNHTLESTVENAKTQLVSANNRIADLERQIASKDGLLYNYEKQIAELTTHVAELETKLRVQAEERIRAEEELSAARDLCTAMDCQKEAFRRQATARDAEKTELANEVRRLSEEYEGLNQKLSLERTLSQTLEKSLSNSRQETLEHKITNKDLQGHVRHLKETVDELTRKLDSECQDVRRYQAQCADLSRQVSELRREVTNARFEQAKAAEECRREDAGGGPKGFGLEGTLDEGSARNVPPLTFSEDSDRTLSPDSPGSWIRKFQSEESGRTFRKLDWKLSPLPEGMSGSESDVPAKEATASEFSSLPDDGEARNGPPGTGASDGDPLPDSSSWPTYSVGGPSESRSRVFASEKSGGGANGSRLFWEEEAFEEESCSECGRRKSVGGSEMDEAETVGRVASPSSPSDEPATAGGRY